MSTVATEQYGENIIPKIQTCVIMNKPVKHNLQRLATLKHTTVSYLINEAAEEYLRKYVKSREEIIIQ
jgi:hypothetical protein